MQRPNPQATPVVVPTKTIVLNRLSQSAYTALLKATTGSLPKVPPTDGAAHFACGAEFVLRALRDGYVMEGDE